MVLSGPLPDVEQATAHLFARDGVERAERLVHQQHLRVERERTSNRDALAHAAGKLRRHLLFRVFKADELAASPPRVPWLARL